MLKVNKKAHRLVNMFCTEPRDYGVVVEKTGLGATLIDAGIKTKGGFSAGRIITEICMGGYGKAHIFPSRYDDLVFPSIFVQTDEPAVATLGSQFAGWPIKTEEYSAIGSGPARALALKPKKLYEKIGYEDKSEVAVLVLETDKKPPDNIIQQISNKCKVAMKNLYLILVPTTSLAGFTQVSGRIVETGVHKLMKLGLNPKVVEYAWGSAPIMPPHPKFNEAMGRTNDAILYAGTVHFQVNYGDDKDLERIVNMAPSSASPLIRKAKGLAKRSPSFLEILKDASYDFYKIDPNVFAPAIIMVNNIKTGRVFKAGGFEIDVLKASVKLE